jgi:hypothetical protein
MFSFVKAIGDVLHDHIFSGGIKKGGTWGGPVCRDAVPLNVHVWEVALWCVFSYFLNLMQAFPSFCLELRRKAMHESTDRLITKLGLLLDMLFASTHLGLWLLVLYYKINLRSLVNLLQPCHLTLLAQGLAIVVGGPSGAILTLILLPMTLIGASGALAMPATAGLDQPFETESFFIQHYLLLVTPLYALLRDDAVALKLFSFRTILLGNWVAILIHWAILAVSICGVIIGMYGSNILTIPLVSKQITSDSTWTAISKSMLTSFYVSYHICVFPS